MGAGPFEAPADELPKSSGEGTLGDAQFLNCPPDAAFFPLRWVVHGAGPDDKDFRGKLS